MYRRQIHSLESTFEKEVVNVIDILKGMSVLFSITEVYSFLSDVYHIGISESSSHYNQDCFSWFYFAPSLIGSLKSQGAFR